MGLQTYSRNTLLMSVSHFSEDEFLELIRVYAPDTKYSDLARPFKELGLDSLAMVQIRVAIEKKFKILISHKEWFKLFSFDDVAAHLRGKL